MHQVLSSRGCKKITNDYVCLFHSAAPKILLRSFIYVYPPPDILRTYKHDVMVKLVAYVCLQVIYIYINNIMHEVLKLTGIKGILGKNVSLLSPWYQTHFDV
jgi:hypothetical protein